jgi:glycosyltransferase involved in cell wall biosynthesis
MGVPKVSVIIPVYNAAAFLEQCIESVLTQSLREIEVIVVNDGSTDASGVILDRLAATDERLRVFHLPNKGVSAARNFGLDQARGTYIGFCDADDVAGQQMFEKMYEALRINQSDWCVCNVELLYANRAPITRLKLANNCIDLTVNKAAVLFGFMRFDYDNANWNKLYAADVIRANKLCFDERLFMWEDLLFNLQYLQFAEKLCCISELLYQYRVHESSVMGKGSDRYVEQFQQFYLCYKETADAHLAEWRVFEQETARIFYYQIIDYIFLTCRKKGGSFLATLSLFRSKLAGIHEAIIASLNLLMPNGLTIKQRLLQGKFFFLFSFITCVGQFLKAGKFTNEADIEASSNYS